MRYNYPLGVFGLVIKLQADNSRSLIKHNILQEDTSSTMSLTDCRVTWSWCLTNTTGIQPGTGKGASSHLSRPHSNVAGRAIILFTEFDDLELIIRCRINYLIIGPYFHPKYTLETLAWITRVVEICKTHTPAYVWCDTWQTEGVAREVYGV